MNTTFTNVSREALRAELPRFLSYDEAVATATKLNSDQEDNWRYEAFMINDTWAVIAIYDETGTFVSFF